ncbi:MAG TPA: outer membrane beta-barrel protein [Stellaceae bacterium]|nr:outer membrane beta-barrel protein [Stellaceae bacterium]
MINVHRLFAVAAVALIEPGAAWAADPGTWTGIYIGANAGYGWGSSTGSRDGFSPDFADTIDNGANVPTAFDVASTGSVFGGQVGYNWQIGMFVLGFETDVQKADIAGSQTIQLAGNTGGGFAPSVSTAQDHLDWFGTARARLGVVPCTNLLIYGTGGFALGSVDDRATLDFNPATAGTFAGARSSVQGGWSAGGGGEYRLTPQLSIKAEYLHLDLGTNPVRLLDPVHFPGSFVSYRFSHVQDIARVGMNWRF